MISFEIGTEQFSQCISFDGRVDYYLKNSAALSELMINLDRFVAYIAERSELSTEDGDTAMFLKVKKVQYIGDEEYKIQSKFDCYKI